MNHSSEVIKKFREAIERFSLIQKGDRIAIALSGGPDSVVLTHLLLRIAPEYRLKLFAVHVDHRLRGKISEKEAEWVRVFSKKAGIRCRLYRLRGLAGGTKNLQEAARQQRYDRLVKGAVAFRATKIATAHHADDQLETVVMRFLQGAGLEGLAGIPIIRHHPIPIIRPILFLTKEELFTYARENRLHYCVDRSNRDPKYWRNRLRLKLIPALKKEAPTLAREVGRLAAALRTDADCFLDQTESLYKKLVRRKKGERLFSRPSFLKIHPALQIRLLKKALTELGGGTRGIAHHLQKMLELIRSPDGRALYSLPGRRLFEKKDKSIRISV